MARKIVGTDSLSLTGDIEFVDIAQKCETLLDAFQSENYKEHFGFIDHLRLVKDKELKRVLDVSLRQAIGQRTTEKLMLAYPEIDNLNQIDRFQLMYKRKKMYCEEVDIETVYDFLSKHNILEVDTKKFFILGLNNNDQPLTKKYSLHDYMVFETTYNRKRYVLTLGNWFELDASYVEQVDRDIAAIDVITGEDYLPPIAKGQREDAYNIMAASQTGYLHLDKKNYPAGGHSKIEVSDLLSPDGEFICVKKYNGSSTLSHLFSQGYVSATLLVDEKQYREFVISQFPDGWEHLFDVDNLEKEKITFVFAIASESTGDFTDLLPFFSKVNLRHTKKSIERLGFKVKLFKIKYRKEERSHQTVLPV